MEIILGVIVVILLIIVATLAIITAQLFRRDKQRENEFEFVLEKTLEDTFKREKKKIARTYVEAQKLAKWADKILKSDKVDTTKLATETEQRAYVLALKKAEDAVLLAESGLEVIRQEILKAQKELKTKVYIQASGPYKHHKEALHRLYAQEKTAEKRVKSARKRLTLLTADVSTTDLDQALESLEEAPAMVPIAVNPIDDQIVLPIEVESITTKPSIKTESTSI